MPRKRMKEPLTMNDLFLLVAEKKNGKANYGAILQYYRVLIGWKAWELALFYSEALKSEGIEDEGKLITPSWIYMMEQQNMVPIDKKRRWLLARLLDIPPILFGLDASEQDGWLSLLFGWEKVDVVEYRTALEMYCTSWGAGKIYESILDIKRRISNLNNEAFYTSSQEKTQMMRLLCEYFILEAVITHNQCFFDLSIESLGKAITLAQENKFYDVWSYAFRQRGSAYLEKAEISLGLGNLEGAQKDFASAVTDLDSARSFAKKISPHRKGLIDLVAGNVYAHTAQDKQELLSALEVIDAASREIGRSEDDARIPSKLDKERYYLDKGSAYIASIYEQARFPQAARNELDHATNVSQPLFKTRHAYGAVRYAQTYFVEKDYPMAIAYGEQALSLVKDVKSETYLAFLDGLYRGLRASPFGKESSVAQFGIELLKVQQPQLFSK